MVVFNANYLKVNLNKLFTISYPPAYTHQFFALAGNYLPQRVKTLELAKRLLDNGVYAQKFIFYLLQRKLCILNKLKVFQKVLLIILFLLWKK